LKLQPIVDVRYRRLSIAIGIAILVAFGSPREWQWPLRTVVSWDVGAIVFLALVARMIIKFNNQVTRNRAAIEDENRWIVLLGGIVGRAVSLLAIVYMLRDAKSLAPKFLAVHVGLAAFTVLCSWLLTHTMFALQYAHDYYAARAARPDAPASLEFPQEEHPDYWDFMYFSLTIGMTSQVADVNINSRHFRRLCTVHGMLAFVFNTAIVAMNINLIAGLV
jgi:uncharacterized membrane protein